MMKKCLYTTVAIAALAVMAPSNAKAEYHPMKGNNLVFVSGHAEAGIYKNQYWNDDNGFHQNTRDDLQFNQGVVAAGKKLDKAKAVDFGGRVDVMFGTDARFVQSDGLERHSKTKNGARGWGTGDYFTAISQAYLEGKYESVSLKVGKMLNPLGHDSIYSTDRFFYSLSNAYYLRPATISGAVANWDSNCGTMNVYGGYMSAADQTFDSRENNGVLAGFGYKVNNQLKVKAGAMYEKRDQFANMHRTSVNAVADYAINSKMNYTFEVTYAQEKLTATGAKARAYSYNNELTYKLNDKVALGGRFEYVHTYGNVSNDSNDMYSLTLGANYSPVEYVTIKPEVRYDRGSSDMRPFEHDGSGKKDQFSAGVSALVKF